ncbi:hypothetical protein [Kitasatospora sp. NPDC001547]|uniref:hypothetical protein n=1 Tax=Kitasatospora sp. NPDC001547 TaxID=3364015 RepID=UPI0036D0EAA5
MNGGRPGRAHAVPAPSVESNAVAAAWSAANVNGTGSRALVGGRREYGGGDGERTTVAPAV